MVEKQTIQVPADVPKEKEAEYTKNIELVTHGLRRMMLFAGDQKIEHLNDDFGSADASPEDADPEHMFKIASKARISCFATQLGLLSKYGRDYPTVPYVIKLNSKTNIVPVEDKDPLSEEMITPEEVVQFKQDSGLNIVGMGYTLYLGSEYETQMLKEASEAILKAHQNGMFFILWVYPRGKNVSDPYAPHIIAGATGVAVSLGSDFVKVTYPKLIDTNDPIVLAEKFKEAVSAAGRTMVIVSGGSKMEVPEFLQQLHNQIHISGAAGNATGRNVHMRPLEEAVRFCNAISAIVFDDTSPEGALKIYDSKDA